MLTVKGLVIRERQYGDNDKFLSILTDSNGLLDVYAKGVKKQNAKNASVSQTFCYANFCFSEGKNGGYILNSAEPIRLFYDIRLDVSRFSLASYFCEMILYTCVSEQPSGEVLRLMLNALHFLSTGEKREALVKSVFELRLLCELGLTPNLIGCCKCYKYSDVQMQFDLSEGKLYCENCCGKRDLSVCEIVDMTTLHAIRHIALSEQDKIFSFRIPDEYLPVLSNITERYAEIQLGHSFQTLDFYKSLQNDNMGENNERRIQNT
ncbi:MAG: DNA repair protein RecO [Oscillospiraceae bacterium]|nr:DNA repair protein RecO [Oscillospiraceae bacterium]